MEEFDLSSNCIGGEGAKSVGSALNKMRRLDVGYCRMTRHEVAHLSEGLLRLSHPVSSPSFFLSEFYQEKEKRIRAVSDVALDRYTDISKSLSF